MYRTCSLYSNTTQVRMNTKMLPFVISFLLFPLPVVRERDNKKDNNIVVQKVKFCDSSYEVVPLHNIRFVVKFLNNYNPFSKSLGFYSIDLKLLIRADVLEVLILYSLHLGCNFDHLTN